MNDDQKRDPYTLGRTGPHGVHTCEVCGRPLRIQKRGRPAFAHAECRKLDSFLGAVESRLADPSLRLTRPAAKALRTRFWALANQINGLQDPESDPNASARSTPFPWPKEWGE